MKPPLVSITSAFYNEEATLLDMVKSVFAQTFTDWELILVDDGSTDGSLKLVRSIDDPRVRVFSNDRNLGRAATLNKITSLAKGQYIARMDADDICSPSRIEKQIKLLLANTNVDLAGTGIIYLDRNDNPVGHQYVREPHEQICRTPYRTFGLCHASIMAKKSWFEAHPYNESFRLAIDFNLFLRSYKDSVFANVPEPLYYYRLDQSFCLRQQWIARQAGARFLFDARRRNGQWGQALLSGVYQYAKFLATVVLFAAGMRGKLMARRYKQLTDEQRGYYLREIELIKRTHLPMKS
jgi:glycosyltransferase involved in cell wall biosynthesis